ncbi:MAG: YdjY domain-containing protein [Limisphaerales bacterium]
MKNTWIILPGAILSLLLVLPPFCVGEPPPAPSNNEPLRQISRDVFQLGAVRLDKSRKTVQFPAQLNMNDGVIEYLLVNARGKAYESLLRTDTEPYDIHLAMLLIGAKGAPQTAALLNAPIVPFHVNRPATATNSSPALAIQGDCVSIELAWQSANGRRQLPAEDCIMNLATKTNASRGPWTYNGSRVVNGIFLAQREGSIVALIDDVDALANNPRPGNDNDQIWQINSNALPPLNAPVEVTFKLETQTNK